MGDHKHDHDSADDLLKAQGLKVTEQRRKILNFLIHNHGPFTVEELAVKLKGEGFDLATIYRSMGTFEEAGLVEKRLFGDGPARFEVVHGGECAHGDHEHHHHLMCTVCKNIIRLDMCIPPETLKVVEDQGYAQLKHHLEFSGICPACQKKKGKS